MPNKDSKLFSYFLWENRDVNKDKLGEFFVVKIIQSDCILKLCRLHEFQRLIIR